MHLIKNQEVATVMRYAESSICRVALVDSLPFHFFFSIPTTIRRKIVVSLETKIDQLIYYENESLIDYSFYLEVINYQA